MNPVSVVLAVAVTSPFVHPFGLYVNFAFELVSPVTVSVFTFIVLDCFILPTASYTIAYALYVLFCVNPVNVCVLVVFAVVAVYVSVAFLYVESVDNL